MGATCGGFRGVICDAATACIWFDHSCGAADGTGTCEPRPQACPTDYQPVCACSGLVYSNQCEAKRAGFDVSRYASCTPPVGYFPCGYGFCRLATSFCHATLGGAAGNPGTFTCEPLPSSCGNSPSCSCLAQASCGVNCQGTADAGLVVTCYAP